MHQKLGFQIEGRVRRAIFSQGDYHDEIIVGITAGEFFERHPK
jgi:RimJ/RimL family protein N-acetyltransferase